MTDQTPPPSTNPTFPSPTTAPASNQFLPPTQWATPPGFPIQPTEVTPSPHQPVQPSFGAVPPGQYPYEYPQQSKRGISRRAVIASLAGATAIAAAGGGLAWLATSQSQPATAPTTPADSASSPSPQIKATIIEGWRLEQIAYKFTHNDSAYPPLTRFNAQDFLKYALHPNTFPGAASFPILKDIPQGNSMEGFLFPDTYLILDDVTAQAAIAMMLNEFSDKLQQNQLDTLAKQNKLTIYQMVILASIVEREAVFDADRPLVASVYWNRIFRPNAETASTLDADPTVQYARDSQPGTTKYWTPLRDGGRNVLPNSPWNTYTHPGFPPTPICSPGLASLLAAANPAKTDYYFFLSKPDGHNVYEKTYAELLADEQKYLH